jgi:hypothetical protein
MVDFCILNHSYSRGLTTDFSIAHIHVLAETRYPDVEYYTKNGGEMKIAGSKTRGQLMTLSGSRLATAAISMIILISLGDVAHVFRPAGLPCRLSICRTCLVSRACW